MAQGIKRLEIARRCDRANRRWKYIFKSMIYTYQRESIYVNVKTCQRGHSLFSQHDVPQTDRGWGAWHRCEVHKSVHRLRREAADRPLIYVKRLGKGYERHSDHFTAPRCAARPGPDSW